MAPAVIGDACAAFRSFSHEYQVARGGAKLSRGRGELDLIIPITDAGPPEITLAVSLGKSIVFV
jgi:hypothetical protein